MAADDDRPMTPEEAERAHLRGPAGQKDEGPPMRRMQELRRISRDYPFTIGAACFPETHIHATSAEDDLRYLKEKVDAGARFLITQLFFDNQAYYDFVGRARDIGIDVPIIPGIMPITNFEQIKRFTSMCGATIPDRLHEQLVATHADHRPDHFERDVIAGFGKRLHPRLGVRAVAVYERPVNVEDYATQHSPRLLHLRLNRLRPVVVSLDVRRSLLNEILQLGVLRGAHRCRRRLQHCLMESHFVVDVRLVEVLALAGAVGAQPAQPLRLQRRALGGHRRLLAGGARRPSHGASPRFARR